MVVYKLRQLATGAATALHSLVLPPVCLACGARGQMPLMDLCAACRSELPATTQACQRCAIPLQGREAEVCGACLRRPPRYDRSYCAYRYAYPIEHFVRALKYGHSLAQARVLGELLADYLQQQRSAPLPDCLIPVPLATRRYRERGYNQVIEMGRFIEQALGIAMRTDLLSRTRHTIEQAGLTRRERRKNLRRAFAVMQPPPAHVAILDDVVTTGSTVNEIAHTLRRAGAQQIEVWAVARAVLK